MWADPARRYNFDQGSFLFLTSFFFFFNFIYLFIYIYFWPCWVFVSVQGPSLVVASGGHSSSRCVGLSLSRPLLLRSTGSRRAGSVVVAHGPSCSAAYGIFPDQGSNPCPLHWQADSEPLRRQGSRAAFLTKAILKEGWCLKMIFCQPSQRLGNQSFSPEETPDWPRAFLESQPGTLPAPLS